MGSSASATRRLRLRPSTQLAAAGTVVRDEEATTFEPVDVEYVSMSTRRPAAEPSLPQEGGYFFTRTANRASSPAGHNDPLSSAADDPGNRSDNKDTSIASRNSLRSSVGSQAAINAFGMPLVIPVQQHLTPCEVHTHNGRFACNDRVQAHEKLDDDRPLPLTMMSSNSLATESSGCSNKGAQDSIEKRVVDAGFTPWGKPLSGSAAPESLSVSAT